MSVLSTIFDTLENRVLHVPAKDIAMVVDAYNQESEAVHPGAPDIDAAMWRRFEEIQARYTTHRIQTQATPKNPLLAGVVGPALGSATK